jgi:hypothetical protein
VRDFILFFLIVVAGTGGELFVSRAMKVVGEAPSLHPGKMLRVILRALTVPWMWLGVAMMAIAFFALLGALSLYNVCFSSQSESRWSSSAINKLLLSNQTNAAQQPRRNRLHLIQILHLEAVSILRNQRPVIMRR